MRRSRIRVWIEQGSINGRPTPTREGIVPCRPAKIKRVVDSTRYNQVASGIKEQDNSCSRG